jgi:hypothetical protein
MQRKKLLSVCVAMALSSQTWAADTSIAETSDESRKSSKISCPANIKSLSKEQLEKLPAECKSVEDNELLPWAAVGLAAAVTGVAVYALHDNNNHHEAIKILKNIFAADKRVLNPKNMEIGISEFGDNSVRIAAYARVKSNDFLDVQYSIMSDVKDAFDKYGIDIPYPQRVVYIQNVDTSTGEIKGTKKKATTTNVALDDSLES